jgi:hypothetical protein
MVKLFFFVKMHFVNCCFFSDDVVVATTVLKRKDIVVP